MNITDFKDVHTHNLAGGPDSVINLPLGAELPAEGYYSVGIHPWDTTDISDKDIVWVENYAPHPRVVAIGEAGLDAKRGASLARQEEIFRRLAALSESVGKPMIIHAVHTFNDIIRLRKELKPTQRWIIHGFRGKPQLARQLLDAGLDISLGTKYNPATLDVVPPDRLFRETDEDYFT